MKFYSYSEIKKRGSIPDYLRSLGQAPDGAGRYCRPWVAGSDSYALAVHQEPDGTWTWYDHVDKVGGSIIDLAKLMHGGDELAAQAALGEWLRIDPTPMKESKRRKIVKVYDYHDASGNLVHQTVRYEPKDFSQRRPDGNGGWIWSLKGIEPVLYRLPEVIAAAVVFVCEGEKDADNVAAMGFVATTAPMGSRYWRPSFTETLRGKKVILPPDNDAAGREHLEAVAGALADAVAGLKVLTVPAPHKDISDWLDELEIGHIAGHHDQPPKDILRQAAAAAPLWAAPIAAAGCTALVTTRDSATSFNPEEFVDGEGSRIADAGAEEESDRLAREAARLANAEPFRNYVMVTEMVGKREKTSKKPRLMREMIADVFARFHGFPRRVGESLFDLDHDTGNIRWLNNPPELQAWIAEKSRQPVEFYRGEGMVSPSELHASLHANARIYNAISATPTWPRRDDVYYTHAALPPPEPDYTHFEGFCDFFAPATPQDRELLRVFVASCLYYRLEATRPLWVVDSTTGQESGKSTMVQMVARLLGGDLETQSPVTVTHKQLQNDNSGQVIWKRVLSQSGRRKRILLIDNVTGRFVCPELATMITLPAISGMAPYGHGEETRPNDLTYTLTANTASLDRDLTSRAVFIQLAKAERDPGWARQLTEFIGRYRLHVISEIIALLSEPVTGEFKTSTRFEVWESEVATRIIRDPAKYDAVWAQNEERKVYSDSEREEAELIREHIEDALRACGLDPAHDVVWLQSDVITRIAEDAVPAWRGKHGSTVQRVKQLAKNGSIAELSAMWETWPRNGEGRKRGIGWNIAMYDVMAAFRHEANPTVHVLAVRDGKIGRILQ